MSRNLMLLFTAAAWIAAVEGFHIGHRASCEKKVQCNGNLMCAHTCVRGTVEVDDWATAALAYQRQLQRNDAFVFLELPSTHNSAISEADGFGIEKYFISALQGGTDLDQGDDVGEGVCQYLSLTDQLRMGVRHLEVDIWWGPAERDVVVCHSPIPLYPVGAVNRAAAEANLTLSWEPAKMSCAGTKRMLTDVLGEIRDWMLLPENSEEIVVIYFDTKFYLSPEQVTLANQEILDTFGSLVWSYSDGSPLQLTVQQLLLQGKRILFENGKDCWLSPSEGDPIVFYPTLWTHQFGSSQLMEFPNCSVEGDSSWYGQQQVRALDGSFIEAATRCGVQVASGDYTNPDDMKLYVWSWDQQQPADADGCVAMLPSGRWATLPCETQLPVACLRFNSDSSSSRNSQQQQQQQLPGYALDWAVDLDASSSSTWHRAHEVCTATAFTAASADGSSGSVKFAAPHNGYANNVLVVKAYGQTIWLNAPNPLQ